MQDVHYIYNIGMKIFEKISKSSLAAVSVLLFANTVEAGVISFDGVNSGVSLSETVRDIEGRSLVPSQPAIVPAAGVRIYDFKTLYRSLGYSDPGYFGASEEAVRDLETYASQDDTFYQEINNYLRFYPQPYDWYGTGPEDAGVIVKNIDSIFNQVPVLPYDLILFRGLDLKFRVGKAYAINEEFVDKGYVSTSVSFKVARYFAIEMNDNAATSSRKAVFTIYANRQGERGILVDRNEDEVILRHGMKFKVMAKKNNIKKYDLYLVQMCSTSCDAFLRTDVRDFWAKFNIED